MGQEDGEEPARRPSRLCTSDPGRSVCLPGEGLAAPATSRPPTEPLFHAHRNSIFNGPRLPRQLSRPPCVQPWPPPPRCAGPGLGPRGAGPTPRAAQRRHPPHGAFDRSENSGAVSRPRAHGPTHPAARGSRRPRSLAARDRARAAVHTPSRAASAGGRALRPGSRPPAGAAAPGRPRALATAERVCAP
uniref:Uncharacterized protein n=1 Tax=Ursus americanus TaxID=9643 RepID=A0A452RIB3_URSAM